MGSVFGCRYDFVLGFEEVNELGVFVKEGFELLGVFNLVDYLLVLKCFDV